MLLFQFPNPESLKINKYLFQGFQVNESHDELISKDILFSLERVL
jgi:hypothetical protein